MLFALSYTALVSSNVRACLSRISGTASWAASRVTIVRGSERVSSNRLLRLLDVEHDPVLRQKVAKRFGSARLLLEQLPTCTKRTSEMSADWSAFGVKRTLGKTVTCFGPTRMIQSGRRPATKSGRAADITTTIEFDSEPTGAAGAFN